MKITKRRALSCLMLRTLTLAVLTACGSPSPGQTTVPNPSTPNPTTPVQVTGLDGAALGLQNNTLSLLAGEVTRLSWLPDVAWTSSNPAVLAVEQPAAGGPGSGEPGSGGSVTLRALKSGEATLRGVYSPQPGLTTELRVVVEAGRVTAINVSPVTSTLAVGEAGRLSATVSGKGTYSTGVTWQSSRPEVASVSAAGVLSALGEGTATITATSTQDSRQSASASLTIVAAVPSVGSVSITAATALLSVGDTQTLRANVSGTGPYSSAVTWQSSQPDVLRISSGGVVQALGVGRATVTATSVQDSRQSASLVFTVQASAPSSVTQLRVTPSRLTLAVGGTQTLTSTATGTGSYNSAVTWHSSNAAVATISAQGVVKALGAGTATMTATSVQNPSVSASAVLTVPAAATTSDPFNITLVFPANDGLTETQRQAFQTAARRWESVITRGLPDTLGVPVAGQVITVDDVAIEASGVSLDGVGGVVGQAGPRYVRASGLPLTGLMEFDQADLGKLQSTGTLVNVIMHEMGHVLGLGTLWDRHMQHNGGTSCQNATQVKYLGAGGLNEYRTLGGVVPWVAVEDRYSSGTKCGHWKESVFATELMTGFANVGHMPLSRITVGALNDLGYSVNYGAADPFTLPSLSAQAQPQTTEIQERLLLPLPTPFPGAQ